MNLYLTRHQYSNASTEDLWAALEETSLKPIKTIMPSWTKQMGFPLITIESSVQENNNRILLLSQQKFCASTNQIGKICFLPIIIRFFVLICIENISSLEFILKNHLLNEFK